MAGVTSFSAFAGRLANPHTARQKITRVERRVTNAASKLKMLTA
jgi:hypothetical protein